MAKKSKPKAPPQAQPIVAPAPVQPINIGSVYRDTSSGVNQISNSVLNANQAGANSGIYALINYLQTGGRSTTIDPTAAAGFNKTISTNQKLIGSTSKNISKTETSASKLNASITKQTEANKTKAASAVAKLEKEVEKLTYKYSAAEQGSKQFKALEKQIAGLNTKITDQKKLAETGVTKKVTGLQNKLTGVNTKLTGFKTNLEGYSKAIEDAKTGLNTTPPSVEEIYQEADPYTYEYLDLADQYAQELGKITEQGQQFLDQAKQNFQAAPIQQERVNIAPVEDGPLGQALYAQAMDKAYSLGRLTPEQERDAMQAARAGMAARGLGVGQSALAAEMLNRDRFSRQRQMEDLGFAQGVQQNDLSRQFQNQQNALAAGGINVENNYRSQVANEQNRLAATQQTINQLGAASNYVDATRRAGMTAAVDMAGVRSTYNPLFRNLGMSQQNFFGTNNLGTLALSPSAQIGLGVASQNADIARFNTGTQLQTDSFNANMLDSRYNTYQNNQAALQGGRMQAGAANQAGMMGMLGSLGGGGMAAAGSIGGAVILGGAI